MRWSFGRYFQQAVAAFTYVTRRFGIRWFLLAAILSLFLTLLVISAFSKLGSPRTLSVIVARAEQVSFLVANPEQARLVLSGFRVWTEEHSDGACLAGVLEPAVNARVTYRRRGDRLEIELEQSSEEVLPTARLRPSATANWTRVIGPVVLLAEEADRIDRGETNTSEGTEGNNVCGELQDVLRLPIRGSGVIGEVLALRQDNWTYTLLDGVLWVYGRTLPIPGFADGGAIYPVFGEPMQLPPGSRLSTERGKTIEPRDALIGFATVNRSGSLDIAVSTEAGRLDLFPAGGRPEPIGIEITLFSQVLNDPNVLQVQIFVLIFIFLLPILLNVGSLIIAERQASPKPEAESRTKKGAEN